MKAWGRLIVVATAAFAVGVSASAQSLGDVAKKEQQRRKTTKTSGKTYTNKDLGVGSEAAPPPPPQSAAGAPGASTSPAGQAPAPDGTAASSASPGGTNPAAAASTPPAAEQEQKDPKQTEEYWRQRIEGARAELQRNELFLEALQSRVNALATDFVNRDDPYQRATIANDRQKTLAEMERTKTLIQKLKQEIVDIEEEARQAGVPPGWLR